MSQEKVEYELNHHIFTTLCRYVKHIVRFHLDGIQATVDSEVVYAPSDTE